MPRGRCLLGGAVMARRSLLLVVPDLRRIRYDTGYEEGVMNLQCPGILILKWYYLKNLQKDG